MTAYSPSQIYQSLLNAGVPASGAATLTQISGAESSYGANSYGPVNPNGTRDYGVFQINSGAWPQLNPSSLATAPLDQQAQAAATVYNQQGLSAWSTYNSGAYQGYDSGAGGAMTDPYGISGGGLDPGTSQYPDPNGIGGGGSSAQPEGPAAAAISAANGLITPIWELMTRGGVFLLGAMILMVALVAMLWQSKTVNVSVNHLKAAAA